jgi:hypothetical protein
MNCHIHPDRESSGTCTGCGKPVCAECAKPAPGGIYCPQCLQLGIPFKSSGQTNPLAIASLVLSVVALPTAFCYGCGLLFAVAGIITGLIARKEIKNSGGGQKGDGLALAGLIIGGAIVALSILAVVCYLGFVLITVLIAWWSDEYSLLTGLRMMLV